MPSLDRLERARCLVERRLARVGDRWPVRWLLRAMVAIYAVEALVHPTPYTVLVVLALLALAYSVRVGRQLRALDGARALAEGHLSRATVAETAIARSRDARRALAADLATAEAGVWAARAPAPAPRRFAHLRRSRSIPVPPTP